MQINHWSLKLDRRKISESIRMKYLYLTLILSLSTFLFTQKRNILLASVTLKNQTRMISLEHFLYKFGDSVKFSTTWPPSPTLKKYAVFACESCSLKKHSKNFNVNLNCLKRGYNLPIVCRAWLRVGFGCVIFLTGSKWNQQNTPWIQIYRELTAIKGVLVILLENESQPKNKKIRYIQFLPFFLSSFLPKDETSSDIYLITADTTFIPLDEDYFNLKNNFKIRAINIDQNLKNTDVAVLDNWQALTNIDSNSGYMEKIKKRKKRFSTWAKEIMQTVESNKTTDSIYFWKKYFILPVQIGANVSTWREIMGFIDCFWIRIGGAIMFFKKSSFLFQIFVT